jgi:hypothetical protein
MNEMNDQLIRNPNRENHMPTQDQHQKYSYQVLQKLHADAETLLQQYDSMLPHLEHEATNDHLKRKLQSLVTELEKVESLVQEHHPDEEPLGPN